jgi:O-methyltransferase
MPDPDVRELAHQRKLRPSDADELQRFSILPRVRNYGGAVRSRLRLLLKTVSAPYEEFDLGAEVADAARMAGGQMMLSLRGQAALYQLVVHLERQNMPGAIVECGVWRGGSAVLMARASVLATGGSPRVLHLFDSFRGLPEPDSKVDGDRAVREVGGPAQARGRLRVAWDYADRGGPGSVGEVRGRLATAGYDLSCVRIHEGWFQETVPIVAPDIGEIALLHLDGDWYDSTRICLQHLYPSVVSGGAVVVNDYGAYEGCRRAVDQFFDDMRRPRPFLVHVDRDIRYWLRP